MATDSIEEGVKDEKYHTLSHFAFNSLRRAARTDNKCFAVPTPKPDDDPEKHKEISGLHNEAKDLIHMGLLTDESETFRETIALTEKNTGRQFMVVAVTPAAIAMFEGDKKGKIN